MQGGKWVTFGLISHFYASFFVALFKLYTASEQNIDSM